MRAPDLRPGPGLRGRRWPLAAALVFLLGHVPGATGADAKQAAFRRVFGQAARLPPAIVAKVKALPPGEHLRIDRDGDGRHDESWYLDTSRRHTIRPLLVRAIDEDGDLHRTDRPDRDSDLYIADWKADGTVDAAVDYQDNDGDGDVDEMGIYYWWPRHRYLGGDVLWVWWGCDDGDDNLLWYDVDCTYRQAICQYRCHFGGDEHFVGFGIRRGLDRWASCWENPFAFYDPDGDRCSEVVVRICGAGDEVESLRWSFDADADARGRRARDYDFSITALAPGSRWLKDVDTGRSDLKLPEEITRSLRIRGIPTDPVVRWEAAERFARESPWARACLTWDEINANTDADVARDPHERWEGVLNHAAKDFPQIGGPACSRLNKRVELSGKPACPMSLYYDPADHRLHLLGADLGWLHVDYDLDGKTDATYTCRDTDGDGIFDRREIDLQADGEIDFRWDMGRGRVRRVPLRYRALSTFYPAELADVLKQSGEFVDTARAALGTRAPKPDPVETFFLRELPSWCPRTRLGERVRSTPAGARYYSDLLRDRLLGRLQQAFGREPAWEDVEAAYAEGNYAAAAAVVLRRLAAGKRVASPARFRSFARRIPIRVDNRGGPPREAWPVVLTLKAVRTAAGDFNPDHCAVVAPQRWIDWREIPHQVDRAGAFGRRELCFLADVPADAEATWYLHYSPSGRRTTAFPRRTATAGDRGPNVGWESTLAAYRSDHGQLGFFGRTQYEHSRRVERLIFPVRDAHDHGEADWGIDALQVGRTCGLGGMTLCLGQREVAVWNPGGKGRMRFAHRRLASGPVRAAVEITAGHVLPERPELSLRMTCIIYADHRETEILAALQGGQAPVRMAPGLTRLPEERTFLDKPLGCLGVWGCQGAGIGEVGLGLIVPPERLREMAELAGERRLRCEAPGGRLRYWIIGDWRRGRRFPVAPGTENWRSELRALARLLHRDVKITLGPVETLP